MKKINQILLATLLALISLSTNAKEFVHPGGLHTLADLDRMKAKVVAKERPWIDGWNALIADRKAQNTWNARVRTNIGGGGNRQPASEDAHAAYLNTLRWYITGDVSYAECAVRICNSWANNVTEASGELFQLPINNFIQAAELLRIYPGWKAADFEKFKKMALDIFYPACHSFLGNCRLTASWDAPAAASILGIGVLCDDSVKFKEGLNYFKYGIGNGSIKKAINQSSGQVAEMGRDQPHASIGPAALAEMCQTAWNQGDTTLYSFANNRLLAGIEYFSKFNLNHPVDWVPYNDCDNNNWYYPALNGEYRIRTSPIFEMVYNHYAVKRGISAPYTQAMANLNRPELGDPDFFGYGTLTYTLDAAVSPYPPHPVPAAPTTLIASPGISRIYLKWTAPGGDVSQGYNVLRATTSGGPYTTIATWDSNTATNYTDLTTVNGTTYYYSVSAINQSGTSTKSNEVSAQSVVAGNLPVGWARMDIGTVATIGSGAYSNVGNNTFIISGSGTDIGGSEDSYSYVYTAVTGDFTLQTRISNVNWSEGWNKFGIVFRETLDANSKRLTLSLGDIGGRIAQFGTRATKGGSTTWATGNKFTWVPVWFKLQRIGNNFYAFQSTDGVQWFQIGASAVSMSATYYAGLSSCAGTTSGTLTTAMFDNVTTVLGGDIPTVPTTFSGTAISSSRINLQWKASSATSSYVLKRSTSSEGPFVTIATSITGTTYQDNGLSAATNYFYVLKSANFKGESADSIQTNVQTLVMTIPDSITGLKVASGSLKAVLDWNPIDDDVTYNLKRATVSGGPYTKIATLSTNTFTNTGLVNGLTYYYVVSAENEKGEGVNSAQVNATPELGQLGNWSFDEVSGTTAIDSWGGNHGVLASTATRTAGYRGNALRLDGRSNSYSTLPTGIMSSTKYSFTISGWVKLTTNSAQMRVFDFGNGTNSYMYLTVNGGNNVVRYGIKNGAEEQTVDYPYIFPTGNWIHIAVTQSGVNCNLYINGVLKSLNSSMSIYPYNLGSTTQNYLGKSQWSADPNLNGYIDEFKIYNRALNAVELLSLFNSTVPASPADLTATQTPNTTQVKLNWTVVADATRYSIKRALSTGGPYATLGTSTTTSYTDATGAIGNIYYYIVTAKNVVGESAYSNESTLLLSSAPSVEDNSKINIYPNPVVGNLMIRFNSEFNKDVDIQLLNSNGQKVFSAKTSGSEYLLDMKNMSYGIYLLRISCDNKLAVKKIIKE